MEKSLPLITGPRAPPRPAARSAALRAVLVTFLFIAISWTWFSRSTFHLLGRIEHPAVTYAGAQCKQAPALFPTNHTDRLQAAFDHLFTESFQNASITRLQGAVQVPTESFDDLGAIGEDERWNVFYGFHEYLEKTFPRIHSQLQVEKVNTHGLVFTWQGSDAEKKPVVLMAHQDTVPVDRDTVDSWDYPPWSGHFDGQFIWGRGSNDCKNQLIGTMESLEILLNAGFEPKRTIVLSYGFDEESGGTQGAGHLSQFLLGRYGENGAAAIVDEGVGYQLAYGRGFAAPGVAEKGNTAVEITVRIPGGHSSIPPDHTGIGILSELIAAIEARQYPTYLDDANPYLEFLQCSAEYAPEFPKKLKKLLHERTSSRSGPDTMKTCKHHDRLAHEAAKESQQTRYLMQTSQAVDIIRGGTKINALPESVTASVDHRINVGDSPETVRKHIASIAEPIAAKYNLTLHAFDGTAAGYSSISLAPGPHTLDVAPVTPTGLDAVTPYSVLAGTVRALFSEDTIVAPALMPANTDTKHYWDLTKNIFRFGPGMIDDVETGLGNIHTVNEHVSAINHFKLVRWFTLFVRNLDDAVLETDD